VRKEGIVGLLYGASVVTVMAALSAAVSAQWPKYPTSGVPRLPNGEPNLSAPAPRTPDGKPDLSGMWENERRDPKEPADSSRPPLANFANIGAGFKDGLPLTPWAAEVVKQRVAENSKGNPDAHCLPMGIVQFNTHPFPRKIFQTPTAVLIVYEANSWVRQIMTDGRPLPDNDPDPWWNGYSVGKWDGGILVVDTMGFRDDGWLDIRGNPQTEKARVREKFRRVDYGHLEIEITIDDPKAYSHSWTVLVKQRLMVDTELIEFVCNENERSTQYFDKDK
jgi:hypothetical protein